MKDPFLTKVGGHAVRRKLHATALQGQQTGDIVLSGQHAQIDVVVVLQGLADGNGLIIARGTQVVGTPRHRAGKVGLKVIFPSL